MFGSRSIGTRGRRAATPRVQRSSSRRYAGPRPTSAPYSSRGPAHLRPCVVATRSLSNGAPFVSTTVQARNREVRGGAADPGGRVPRRGDRYRIAPCPRPLGTHDGGAARDPGARASAPQARDARAGAARNAGPSGADARTVRAAARRGRGPRVPPAGDDRPGTLSLALLCGARAGARDRASDRALRRAGRACPPGQDPLRRSERARRESLVRWDRQRSRRADRPGPNRRSPQPARSMPGSPGAGQRGRSHVRWPRRCWSVPWRLVSRPSSLLSPTTI